MYMCLLHSCSLRNPSHTSFPSTCLTKPSDSFSLFGACGVTLVNGQYLDVCCRRK